MDSSKALTTSAGSTLKKYSETCTSDKIGIWFRGNLTVQYILTHPEESLAALKREGGEKRVKALIKAQCIYLNEMLNLPHPLTEAMIDKTADYVMNEYPWLTMQDVRLVFKRAMEGKWGEYYNLINLPMVSSWFRKYADERMEEAERMQMERHQMYEGDRYRATEMRQRDRQEDMKYRVEKSQIMEKIGNADVKIDVSKLYHGPAGETAGTKKKGE